MKSKPIRVCGDKEAASIFLRLAASPNAVEK